MSWITDVASGFSLSANCQCVCEGGLSGAAALDHWQNTPVRIARYNRETEAEVYLANRPIVLSCWVIRSGDAKP